MTATVLGQLGVLSGGANAALGIRNPLDLYAGMLKSRTVADNLIQRFDLRKLYDIDTQVAARKALAGQTSIIVGRDGIITIEVDDRDPKRAADLANGYVDELTKLTQTLAITEASQRRLFFEKQLKLAKDGLSTAEVDLKKTQESTGLIQLDEQGKAMIESIARVRAEIAAKEVELSAMQTFATPQNPEYQRLAQQLSGLRVQLARLEIRSGSSEVNSLLPTGELPKAGLEYLRRLREVKYYETVFELLAKQFELAKVDEARDTSIVQVLDQALPPDKRSGPRRTFIVLATTLLTGVFAVGLALAREAVSRALKSSVNVKKLDLFWIQLGRRRP
jgi:capsule polysaccharide export protein KpsE/RkpR